MLIYDTQLKILTDLNDNCKIVSYFHKSITKLILDIFEYQGEVFNIVKHPNN